MRFREGMSRERKKCFDIVVPMHKWAEVLGLEKVDKLLEQRKAGKKVEVKFREYCQKCSARKAYLEDAGELEVLAAWSGDRRERK